MTELISIISGHRPKQPIKKIEKMLYPEYGDKIHWGNYPPRYKAIFTINSYDNGYMSYVEVYERDSTRVILRGNSLWKSLPFSIEELESKIENYTNIPEVEKDFCI